MSVNDPEIVKVFKSFDFSPFLFLLVFHGTTTTTEWHYAFEEGMTKDNVPGKKNLEPIIN